MNADGTLAVVRSAHFGDTRAIFELIRRHPEELVPRPIGDILQNIDRFLVAETAGHIVGVVSWGVLPELGALEHPSIEIKSLAVDSEQRGAGIGRLLVEEVIRRIRQWEPEQIIALTFKPDFFGKFGFVQVPKETLMHKLYTGCINCTRFESPFTCPEKAMSLRFNKNEEGTT